jgi:osmotically-inducible protein OsmY
VSLAQGLQVSITVVDGGSSANYGLLLSRCEDMMTKSLWMFAVIGSVALLGCQRTDTSQADRTIQPPADTPAPTTPGNTAQNAGPSDSKLGQAVSDAKITASVKTALLAERHVSGTAINVDTSEGRVTLKGTVKSQTEIDRALEIARTTKGVKEVVNQLTIG